MKYFGDPDFDNQAVTARLEELKERFCIQPSMVGRFIFPCRESPPPSIYKYTSAYVAKIILSTKTIRYTQSENLDDILEESPSHSEMREIINDYEDGPSIIVDVADPEEWLLKFDNVKRYREKLRDSGAIIANTIAIFTTNGLHRGWRYELGNRKMKESWDKLEKPLALSLTTIPDDDVMWAIYGDNFRGISIIFNARDRYFVYNRDRINKSGFFSPVTYRKMTHEDYAYLYPFERFFVKSPKWKYQNEWRRVEYASFDLHRNWERDILTFPVPASAISGVIFGPRCSDSDQIDILNTISEDISLHHMRAWKMKRNLSEFSFLPIDLLQ